MSFFIWSKISIGCYVIPLENLTSALFPFILMDTWHQTEMVLSTRGGQSIQARQPVFQSYYHVFTCKFTDGSSLRPFLGKDVPCSMPWFIHSRYTVAFQNSTLYSVTFSVYEYPAKIINDLELCDMSRWNWKSRLQPKGSPLAMILYAA